MNRSCIPNKKLWLKAVAIVVLQGFLLSNIVTSAGIYDLKSLWTNSSLRIQSAVGRDSISPTNKAPALNMSTVNKRGFRIASARFPKFTGFSGKSFFITIMLHLILFGVYPYLMPTAKTKAEIREQNPTHLIELIDRTADIKQKPAMPKVEKFKEIFANKKEAKILDKAKIGDKEAIKVLTEYVGSRKKIDKKFKNKYSKFAYENLWFKTNRAVEALGEIGDESAIEPLIEAAADEVRGSIKALIKIAKRGAKRPVIKAMVKQLAGEGFGRLYLYRDDLVDFLSEEGDDAAVEELTDGIEDLLEEGEEETVEAEDDQTIQLFSLKGKDTAVKKASISDRVSRMTSMLEKIGLKVRNEKTIDALLRVQKKFPGTANKALAAIGGEKVIKSQLRYLMVSESERIGEVFFGIKTDKRQENKELFEEAVEVLDEIGEEAIDYAWENGGRLGSNGVVFRKFSHLKAKFYYYNAVISTESRDNFARYNKDYKKLLKYISEYLKKYGNDNEAPLAMLKLVLASHPEVLEDKESEETIRELEATMIKGFSDVLADDVDRRRESYEEVLDGLKKLKSLDNESLRHAMSAVDPEMWRRTSSYEDMVEKYGRIIEIMDEIFKYYYRFYDRKNIRMSLNLIEKIVVGSGYKDSDINYSNVLKELNKLRAQDKDLDVLLKFVEENTGTKRRRRGRNYIYRKLLFGIGDDYNLLLDSYGANAGYARALKNFKSQSSLDALRNFISKFEERVNASNTAELYPYDNTASEAAKSLISRSFDTLPDSFIKRLIHNKMSEVRHGTLWTLFEMGINAGRAKDEEKKERITGYLLEGLLDLNMKSDLGKWIERVVGDKAKADKMKEAFLRENGLMSEPKILSMEDDVESIVKNSPVNSWFKLDMFTVRDAGTIADLILSLADNPFEIGFHAVESPEGTIEFYLKKGTVVENSFAMTRTFLPKEYRYIANRIILGLHSHGYETAEPSIPDGLQAMQTNAMSHLSVSPRFFVVGNGAKDIREYFPSRRSLLSLKKPPESRKSSKEALRDIIQNIINKKSAKPSAPQRLPGPISNSL